MHFEDILLYGVYHYKIKPVYMQMLNLMRINILTVGIIVTVENEDTYHCCVRTKLINGISLHLSCKCT